MQKPPGKHIDVPMAVKLEKRAAQLLKPAAAFSVRFRPVTGSSMVVTRAYGEAGV